MGGSKEKGKPLPSKPSQQPLIDGEGFQMVGKGGKPASAPMAAPTKTGGRPADADAKASDYPNNENWVKYFPSYQASDGSSGSGQALKVPVAFRARVPIGKAQKQLELQTVLEYAAIQFLLSLVPKDFVSTRPGPAGTPELVVLAPQSMVMNP